MNKTYQPQEIEEKWYQQWEKNGYFKPHNAETSYCIMIPPPNVTGSLHMGHGFQDAIMDALTRYHRMLGEKTLWQVGTDHAGISTQMVVERRLSNTGQSRHDLGREKFIEAIWDWKHSSGGTITSQLRRMGASVDWTRERFTLDDSMNEAVLEVFIRLYDEGLIYRGKRLVNWDPNFQSAISDLEVINSEEEGKLWHIRYPLVSKSDYLTVATTRPETMLGDAAIAVHPNDERYQHLIGSKVTLPLTNRTIPIIADEYVDPAFGSGCVKITPAHDFNDYEVGQRHQLPLLNILTCDAKMNENAPKAYQGMDRFDAREKVIADLTQLDLLEKIEPHKLSVPRADRGNTIIEPYLTDQWFVKTEPLAGPAIDAVKSGKIKIVPENWTKTYYQWMENIQDWCISRQLWWGHRIPAWYDADGNIYVGFNEAAVREKYKLNDAVTLKQDEDVLDTWFSSSLWPFATLGWPTKTEALATFYPTNVLVTGFDIIFFWVARMIMMGLKFMGDVPFHEVYFTGLIRDHAGHKMSKSKGNVIDPIDLIDGIDLESLVNKRTTGLMQPWMAKEIEKVTREEYPNGINAHGTDALRFTYCALATTGRDIRFDISRLEGYRNFCNKIWNAARYVFMNVDGKLDSQAVLDPAQQSLADRWIQSCMQHSIERVNQHLQQYRFDLAAKTLYEFIWHEFCDWYLELSKPVLMGDDTTAKQQLATRLTLVHTLETVMRLLHPIMPFITEEIWQQLKNYISLDGDTVMLQPYPQKDDKLVNPNIEQDVEWLKQVILSVRNIRGEMNVAPSVELSILVHKASDDDKARLEKNTAMLAKLAKITSITFINSTTDAPTSATTLIGEMTCLIPLAGIIDVAAETSRLEKEIQKLHKEIKKAESKLTNTNFLAKAPDNVVAQEKDRVKEFTQALLQLQTKQTELAELDK